MLRPWSVRNFSTPDLSHNLQTFLLWCLPSPLKPSALILAPHFGQVFHLPFRTFVSTYMDIFWREDVDDFRQHILNDLTVNFRHIVRCRKTPPYAILPLRTACTSQFRISRKRRLHVSRKVDFRNNSDITFCSISTIFGLFLVIETTVRLAVVPPELRPITVTLRLEPISVRLGILLWFRCTPAWSSWQMPKVETVDVCKASMSIYVLISSILTWHNIRHHTAIAETRRVVDFHRRQFDCSSPLMNRNRLAGVWIP